MRVVMRIWHSPNYPVLVFILFAVKNARLSRSTSENGVGLLSYDVANLDPNSLNRHLQRLQESLRWIRSPRPKPKPVFRPWGGKRSYDHLQRSPPKSNDFEILCPSSEAIEEQRVDPRCTYVTFQEKKDKFRVWGGKRITNIPEILFPDIRYYESLRSLPNPTDEGHRMIANGWKKPNKNSSVHHETILSNFNAVQSLNFPLQEGDRNPLQNYKMIKEKMLKRQKFYPWGGKRSMQEKRQKFSPWAGKRNVDDYLIYNNLLNDSSVGEQDQDISDESSSFDVNDVLSREKRSITSRIELRPLTIKAMDKNARDDGMPYQNGKFERHNVIKRSADFSEVKKMNLLSNLLKKYEDAKDRSSFQRFSPWAGRKRAEVVTGTSMGKTIAKRGAMSFWTKIREMQRQPFNSWVD